MSTLQKKSINAPDELSTPPRARVESVHFGDMCVVRMTCEPGWKWSEHIKPIAGTPSCQTTHFAYVVSGQFHTVMDDGAATDFGPGDVGIIPPGHNSWVVGDEPCVLLDFQDASRNV
jgi:quercetin dioxygenase-like cupin family protein